MRAGYLDVTGAFDMPVLIRFFDPFLPLFTAVKRSRYTHAWSMIRKSGRRFSEKIMLNQGDWIMMRFLVIAS
jgi:hypothetical protein